MSKKHKNKDLENEELEKEEDISTDLDDEENNYKDEEISTDESDFDIFFKSSANKHKLEGTHRLKRDTIFLGKLENEIGIKEFSEATGIELNPAKVKDKLSL